MFYRDPGAAVPSTYRSRPRSCFNGGKRLPIRDGGSLMPLSRRALARGQFAHRHIDANLGLSLTLGLALAAARTELRSLAQLFATVWAELCHKGYVAQTLVCSVSILTD